MFGIVAGIRPRGDTDPAHLIIWDHGHPGTVYHGPDVQPVLLRDVAAVVASRDMAPAFGSPTDLSHVCTHVGPGTKETWVIENWTDEIHNFHVHQSKFAVDRSDSGADYFQFPDTASEDAQVGATDMLVRSFYPEQLGVPGAPGGYIHDSVPIPHGLGPDCQGSLMPATADGKGCQPGRVTIELPIDRDEQVGTFVYHCHILEHEDRGMMATITVLAANVASEPPMQRMAGMSH